MDPEGLKCHPPDKVKDLRRLFVNSGNLLFARIQITTFSQTDQQFLSASAHRDMVFNDFLYDVVCMCNSLSWLQHETRPLMDLVDAARVKHGKFNPPNSYPTDKELKLVETSSVESTIGSVLTHVTTTIKNAHPNVLDIMFVRRSSGDRSVRHHPFQPIAKWCVISGCDVTILKCHFTISVCDFLFYSIVTNIYLKPAFSEDTGSSCERQREGDQRGGG